VFFFFFGLNSILIYLLNHLTSSVLYNQIFYKTTRNLPGKTSFHNNSSSTGTSLQFSGSKTIHHTAFLERRNCDLIIDKIFLKNNAYTQTHYAFPNTVNKDCNVFSNSIK